MDVGSISFDLWVVLVMFNTSLGLYPLKFAFQMFVSIQWMSVGFSNSNFMLVVETYLALYPLNLLV